MLRWRQCAVLLRSNSLLFRLFCFFEGFYIGLPFRVSFKKGGVEKPINKWCLLSNVWTRQHREIQFHIPNDDLSRIQRIISWRLGRSYGTNYTQGRALPDLLRRGERRGWDCLPTMQYLSLLPQELYLAVALSEWKLPALQVRSDHFYYT